MVYIFCNSECGDKVGPWLGSIRKVKTLFVKRLSGSKLSYKPHKPFIYCRQRACCGVSVKNDAVAFLDSTTCLARYSPHILLDCFFPLVSPLKLYNSSITSPFDSYLQVQLGCSAVEFIRGWYIMSYQLIFVLLSEIIYYFISCLRQFVWSLNFTPATCLGASIPHI